MRCQKCGFVNQSGVTICSNCKFPLKGNYAFQNDDPQVRNYMYEGNSNLRGTILETDVFERSKNAEEYEMSSHNNCPKCGYLLRSNSGVCPNCNYQLTTPAKQYAPLYRNKTLIESNPILDSCRGVDGTINPYLMGSVVDSDSFTLTPVKRANETKDFSPVEFSGESVILTRNNTEEGNQSITSKEQAVINKDGEKWYIEDLSEQKTTFVLAASKIELHDGDIVLMGNRMFEFHKA